MARLEGFELSEFPSDPSFTGCSGCGSPVNIERDIAERERALLRQIAKRITSATRPEDVRALLHALITDREETIDRCNAPGFDADTSIIGVTRAAKRGRA